MLRHAATERQDGNGAGAIAAVLHTVRANVLPLTTRCFTLPPLAGAAQNLLPIAMHFLRHTLSPPSNRQT